MSKEQGKSRKPLIIGIVAAVIILAALLGLLLTQCDIGGKGQAEITTAPATTQPQADTPEIPEYDLYWNVDRALYDGKSEAGMSSRTPGEDGLFHVRFFFEGEMVELRVADRKTVNAIEVNDVMGLIFDDKGIVIGVTSIDDMPLEQVGWQFYVQSVGGTKLKLNSSKANNGLEVLLDILDFTGIWDMTGKEAGVGAEITPIAGDRVIAIANLAGQLTHVYVYDRPEFMESFEGYCQHCEETVQWKKWTKENVLPSTSGHYQLQNNISGMSAQQYIQEDQKVCLDLNGMTVDGKENARVYTLHYPGAHLAIMDNSEEQKGVLRGHSTSSDQGGVVWVRYGQFHLYSGTLDGSDMISDMNGAAVDVPKGAFFYMHGGRLIGGNAKAVKNDKGNWTNGLGGTIVVRGKFVLNDGIIEGGRATGVVTKYNADGTPNTYQRGIGGNIYVGSGGVFEMNGGIVKNGTATHSGGNIYVDGTAEFNMNGGTITGGKVTGKGRNGGNVFITSKSVMNFNGGSIVNGVSYNCGANMYLNGTVNMNGGYIGGGKIYDWATKKLIPTETRVNVFSVQGDFYMYGGKIDGGFYAFDTTANDKNPTVVLLSGYATIKAPEGAKYDSLFLNAGGDSVTVRVGKLLDGAIIGVNTTTGIFTEPTAEHNTDNFFSDVDDAYICYVDGRIGLGRFSCICGNNEKGEHFGKCHGEQLFWGPVTGVDMPKTSGNYYLPRVMDANGNLVPRTINAKEQSSMVENAEIKLDLNGGTIVAKKNFRFFSLHNPGAYLVITDSSENKTGLVKSQGEGTTQGNVVWVRYGQFDLYGGTLDGSGYKLYQSWDAGTDKLFGTEDDKVSGRDGGTVSMSTNTVFNMYGGTIIGNTAPYMTQTKTNKIETEVDGEKVVTEETAERSFAAVNGASLLVGTNCTFNMYAGTIRDGYTENAGGNIYVYGKGVVNLYDGTISGGQAGPAYAEDGKTILSNGWGGNVELAANSTMNILGENALITGGVSGGNGGNIRILGTLNMKAGTISDGETLRDQGGNIFNSGALTLSGGVISGGKAKNGGNIGINSGKDTIFDGVVIENGDAGTGYGGNIRISTTNKLCQVFINGETIIRNGKAKSGANIAVGTNDANKNDPVAYLEINGGTISGGLAKDGSGGALQTSGTTEVVMNGGIIKDNVARWGGSMYLTGTLPFTMNGGTVENGSTYNNGGAGQGNGGNIYASATPIVMNGGEIKNGKTGDHGGNIWTQNTVTMNGGTISGGEAIADNGKGGGNLFTNNANGRFYLNGGTVEGGKAGKGGSIFISHASAQLVIDGATVTGGQTIDGHGGNINSIGTVTVKSGVVKDGIAKNTAGNIYANAGTVIIEGGKIYGGQDKNNATSPQKNIYIVCAALELRGGEIDGAVSIINYNNNNGSLKMSGNPVIKSETTSGLTLTWANGTGGTASQIPFIEIDAPMTEGAEVYITSTKWEVGRFTGETEEAYAKYFHSDDETRSVAYMNGTIHLGKTYCLCGSTTENHDLGCDGKQLFWTPWCSTGTLPTEDGNYYIHPSVTVSLATQWQPPAGAKINLDLNGRTIKTTYRGFALNNPNVNVTLTDTVGGGKLVKTNTYNGQGGLVWVNQGSTFTLIKGTIDGTGCLNNSNGAGICVEGTGSKFFMYGGTVKGAGSSSKGGNLAVKETSEFYMYGGTIEGGRTYHSGGNLYMTHSAKAYLYGGTITGGLAGKDHVSGSTNNGWGGNIEMVDTSYLLIEDGVTISGGRTTGNGGNIRAGAECTVDMTGGLITDGRTADNGGNIFMQGTLTVTGGQITNGYAKTGGNISFNSAKESTLNNVTISGGEATNQGGNVRIFNASTTILNIGGGTHIFGGIAPAANAASANLNVTTGCTVKLGDCQIDGYAKFDNASAKISITGKTVIYGGDTNLTLNGAMLNVKDLADDALIGINYAAGGIFTTETKEEYLKNFVSDDPELVVEFVDGKMVLALGRFSCLCGSKNNNHELGCDGTEHFWMPWNSGNSLPMESGYWYLTQDEVVLSGQFKIESAQNIVLDLNGKTVKNAEGKNIRFYWLANANAQLTITDTVGGGNMTNNGTYTQGMIAWVNTAGSKVTLIKGILDLSDAAAGNYFCAPNAICLVNAGCTFTMYGGTILGGKSLKGGGVVCGENWDSIFYMYGGTITGHPEETYPAVHLQGRNNMICGGTITGGVELNSYRFDTDANPGGAYLLLKGNPSIDSILLNDELTAREGNSGAFVKLPLLKIEGKLENTTPIKLSVIGNADHVFTQNVVDAANATKLVAANDGQTILFIEEGANAGKLYIGKARCICGATDGNHTTYTDPNGNVVGCDGELKPFMAWTTTTSLPTATGYYYLTADVDYVGQASIAKNAQVVLDLNGKTVKPAQKDGADVNARAYSVHNEGVKLTIVDTVGTGKIIASATRNDQGNVLWIRNDPSFDQTKIGTIVLMGGTLQGANPSCTNPGSVVNVDGKGKFYMLGGTIQGGATTGNGGNVAMDGYAEFYMVDGTITGGTAKWGGNVFVDDNATFTMVGGTIENGNATSGGGNVCVDPSATFTLENGTVTGGITIGGDGGNFYVAAKGNLNMNNGTISDGKALRPASAGANGGNILNKGNLKVLGGTISGGIAFKSTADGQLDYNTKAGWGANICHTAGTLEIKNATITGGLTGGNGGSVYTSSGLTMENTTVSGGQTWFDNGGNLFMSGATAFTITNSEITGGKANHGGNVSINSNGTVTITDTKITGGHANGEGGNLRAFNASTTVLKVGKGTVISGGTAGTAATADLNLTTAITVELADCQIKGKASIAKNDTKVTVSGNVVIDELTYGGAMTVGTMTSGAKINLNRGAGVFTANTVDASYAEYFTSVTEDTDVAYVTDGVDKGKLAVGRVYAACGQAEEHDAHDYCDGKLHTWLIWDSKNTVIPEQSADYKVGYWYLNAPMTVSSTATYGSGEGGRQVYFDLNGQTVTVQFAGNGVAARMISTNGLAGGSLKYVMTNLSSGDAKIVVDDSKQSNDRGGDEGRIIWMNGGNASFYMNNIDIDLSAAKTDLVNDARETKDGIAFTAGNGRQLFLTDVNIIGGNAQGAVISIYDGGSATLHNVTVQNHTGSVNGGGILVKSNTSGKVANLTLSGNTKITGCTKLDGTPANITLQYVPNFTLTESYVGSTTAPQGIDAPVNTVILADGNADFFRADDVNKALAYAAGGMVLVSKTDSNAYCICGSDTETHALGCDGTLYVWTDWTSTNSLPTALGNYRLTAPVNVTSQYALGKDGTTRLDLNGQTVTDTAGRLLTTASANGGGNLTLWITDTSEKQEGKLKLINATAYNGQGGVVWVTDNSTLNLIAGTLDASETNLSNGSGGGAVCLQGLTSVFNIYGGNIIGGTTKNGAAITVDRGTLNIYGGTITGGTASEKGGSVFVTMGGDVNMYGGTVTGGNSVNGGNFYFVDDANYSCKFVMTGGNITNGIATTNGGNVWFGAYNEMTMSGGSITGGQHNSQGGNIYLSGLLKMSGGTIKGGSKAGNASHTSANMALTSVGQLEMTGGTIEGRVAPTTTSKTSKVTLSGLVTLKGSNSLTIGSGLPVYIGKLETGSAIRVRMGSKSTVYLNAMEGYTLTEADAACITGFYHLSVDGTYTSTEAKITLDTANNRIVVSFPTE